MSRRSFGRASRTLIVNVGSVSQVTGASEFNDALNAALDGVDPSAPSTTKFVALDRTIADHLRLEHTSVVSVTLSKSGNLSVRATQSKRSQAASFLVGVLTLDDEGDREATRRLMTEMVEGGRPLGMMEIHHDPGGRWVMDWAVIALGEGRDELATRMIELGLDVVRVAAEREAADARVPPESRPDLSMSGPTEPLIVDDRVRRMLRLAVASRPAVMLVGPPGTGKSQLLGELVTAVAKEPSAFGMAMAHDASMVTLDESWTTRELVGGETVDDDGRLRFSPGHVLQAIADDTWLVLDEANRADLDRIFGGLLSWLSGQTVTVGRISTHPGAGPVRLGWNDGPTSRVVGEEQLTAAKPSGESVDYLAGSEWRLLGTYNALDAQRVFRFGLALGRRFAHIPVAPPNPSAFVTALTPRLTGIPDADRQLVCEALRDLYAAHQELEGAIVGPAMFLGMPAYIAAGIGQGGSTPIQEVLAESYLSGLGMWLSRLDDDQLDNLGNSVGGDGPLGDQWIWVRNQLRSLQ